jgi:opacity protein-like surface antigen
MKILKTKIAILAISFVSFLGIQTASAMEGLSLGVGFNYSAFMGEGKETATSSGNSVKTITEEDGAFDTTVASVFAEYAVSDQVSFGIEYVAEDMETPQNTNVQDTLTNTVRADFKDHTTLYANINMPFNTYLKLGYAMVDVATSESLETGGAYPDVDTTGYTIGLGYQHTVDNGVFIRAELSASEYDNVTAQNTNETDKEITVSDMYGASASIKVGKTF